MGVTGVVVVGVRLFRGVAFDDGVIAVVLFDHKHPTEEGAGFRCVQQEGESVLVAEGASKQERYNQTTMTEYSGGGKHEKQFTLVN